MNSSCMPPIRPHAIAAKMSPRPSTVTLENGRRRVLHGPQQRVVLRLLGLERGEEQELVEEKVEVDEEERSKSVV